MDRVEGGTVLLNLVVNPVIADDNGSVSAPSVPGPGKVDVDAYLLILVILKEVCRVLTAHGPGLIAGGRVSLVNDTQGGRRGCGNIEVSVPLAFSPNRIRSTLRRHVYLRADG